MVTEAEATPSPSRRLTSLVTHLTSNATSCTRLIIGQFQLTTLKQKEEGGKRGPINGREGDHHTRISHAPHRHRLTRGPDRAADEQDQLPD